MWTWLRNDVASTSQRWSIAFWHHPPYSHGSHNSDVDYELTHMRQNANPILEAAGVDLVLAGHSESYERSFLIDGHYGVSDAFSASMEKDGGSGREDGTGAYRKPTTGLAPHAGAVYTVVGSSGFAGGGTLDYPAMFVSLNVLGSLVLDVNDGRLDARFIDNNGTVRDYFTILKEPVASPSITSLAPASGPTGTVVTIAGTSFGATAGTSTVRFNGTTAAPASWSNTSIAVPVPAGATTGPVVVTANGVASNGVSFTVTPSITGLTPASGPTGTVMTIAGTNFGATAGTSTVRFNGTTAAPASCARTSPPPRERTPAG